MSDLVDHLRLPSFHKGTTFLRTEHGTRFGACGATRAHYGKHPTMLCETITMTFAGTTHSLCRWCGKAGR